MQAKHYASGHRVQAEEIQKFLGVLLGKYDGVFVTSSDFCTGAQKAAANGVASKVVLVNGEQLVSYMLQ